MLVCFQQSPMRSMGERRLAHDVNYTFWPHRPRLFVTSKTQTTRQKMASVKAVFSWSFKVGILTNYTINQLYNSCESSTFSLKKTRFGLFFSLRKTHLRSFVFPKENTSSVFSPKSVSAVFSLKPCLRSFP